MKALLSSSGWSGSARSAASKRSAAAAVSVLDYLGEVDWKEHTAARDWYVRLKSRPAFRNLLVDQVPGFAPAPHYAQLDF